MYEGPEKEEEEWGFDVCSWMLIVWPGLGGESTQRGRRWLTVCGTTRRRGSASFPE